MPVTAGWEEGRGRFEMLVPYKRQFDVIIRILGVQRDEPLELLHFEYCLRHAANL